MPKPISVAILTPTTGICQMAYAQSLAHLVAYWSQVQVFDGIPTQNLVTDSVAGSGIAENYMHMVTTHLEDTEIHWTHFLSIEDDMGFPPDGLHTLLRRELPIVGANYSTNKGTNLRFTAVGLDGPALTTAESTGVEEVSLLPQGFTLIAREVYEAIPKPWFLTGWNPKANRTVYQDYYFSEQAKKHGFKMYVDHDVSKRVYHVGPHNYTYEDALAHEQALLKQKQEPVPAGA